jgi:hypothetical protein
MACWNALFDQARGACAQQGTAERARTHTRSLRPDLFGPSHAVWLRVYRRTTVPRLVRRLSSEDISASLCNLVTLVAKGRISSRRAAVITYAFSLIFRSVVIMDRKAADTPPRNYLGRAPPKPQRGQTPNHRTGRRRSWNRGPPRDQPKGKNQCVREVLAAQDLSQCGVAVEIRRGVSSTLGQRALLYTSTCAKNRGVLRNFVACSYPYASLINTGSLHARPKKEIPTGKPHTNPAVTLMLG